MMYYNVCVGEIVKNVCEREREKKRESILLILVCNIIFFKVEYI